MQSLASDLRRGRMGAPLVHVSVRNPATCVQPSWVMISTDDQRPIAGGRLAPLITPRTGVVCVHVGAQIIGARLL